MMDIREDLIEQTKSLIYRYKELHHDVGHNIWTFSETAAMEYFSAKYISGKLLDLGYSVEMSVAGYPTAFVGTFSTGKGLTVGLMAEYDALPGIGHGCGHSLFAANSVTAAAVLKDCFIANGIEGTIKVFGTPSEEKNGAKPYMVKQGYMDEVDFFMGFHPLEFNGVLFKQHSAMKLKQYKFHGKSSHAGAEPHLGRSALDAVELMNVGSNYLREHIPTNCRLHYIIKEGGTAPNIVPAYAESHYAMRALDIDELTDLEKRVDNIARGAALMTGTKVEFDTKEAYANSIVNVPYAKIADRYLNAIGTPVLKEEYYEESKRFGNGVGLLRNIEPLPGKVGSYGASTDEGDVSWVAPWIRICTAVFSDGTPGHSEEVRIQSDLPYAYESALHNTWIAVSTIMHIFEEPEAMSEMKQYHEAQVRNKTYNRENNTYPDPEDFPNMPGIEIKEHNVEIYQMKNGFLKGMDYFHILLKQGTEILGEYKSKKGEYHSFTVDAYDSSIPIEIMDVNENDGKVKLLGYYKVMK